MPNYDSTDYENNEWTQRFPEWSRGYEIWRRHSNVEGATIDLFQERLRVSARGTRRPQVFVSHKQEDRNLALSIAHLACSEGFDYWLDVVNPRLGALTTMLRTGALPPHLSAAAIAGVIEMGLLNSTHVIAVMTNNTKQSQWVPYEYGRAKAPTPLTLQAACWVDGSLAASALPEYLHLGVITTTQPELEAWLQSELRKYSGTPGSCVWTGPTPPPL